MPNKTKIQLAGWGKSQYRVTIPRAIGQALGLKKGDAVEWVLVHGDVVIRRA